MFALAKIIKLNNLVQILVNLDFYNVQIIVPDLTLTVQLRDLATMTVKSIIFVTVCHMACSVVISPAKSHG